MVPPPPHGPLPLVERVRPGRLADMVGNSRARGELRAWADAWDAGPPARRAVLLSGPPGVGKTTAALALATEMGWSLVEMNASEARNQGAIDRVAGRASISRSLDSMGKGVNAGRSLILLDEADCLSGRASDRAAALSEPIALREFLRGRYATVEALNDAWGLGTAPSSRPFGSWAAVPKSPGNFGWARLAAARRDIEDWRSVGKVADTSDRGGLGAITRLVRSTRQPLVLTVNDERPLTRYSPVFRTAVLRLRFFPIRDPELRGLVDSVAGKEGIRLAPGALAAIVDRARGDVRAALNDLEAIAPLPPGPAQLGVLGTRDRSLDFETLTEEVLNRPRFYRTAEIRERIDAPPDDLLPWIEENLVRFAPDPRHRAEAFDRLGEAERFLAWARRMRVWSLWSYATELLTGGVGLALRSSPVPAGPGAVFPQFLSEMGRSRSARAAREAVVAKLASGCHLSREKTRSIVLPFIEGLVSSLPGHRTPRGARALANSLTAEFGLSAEEAALVFGIEPPEPPPDAPAVPSEEDPPPEASDAGGREPTEASAPATKRRTQRRLGEFGS